MVRVFKYGVQASNSADGQVFTWYTPSGFYTDPVADEKYKFEAYLDSPGQVYSSNGGEVEEGVKCPDIPDQSTRKELIRIAHSEWFMDVRDVERHQLKTIS